MGITFKPVDKDNWLDCVNLEVASEQNDFVTDYQRNGYGKLALPELKKIIKDKYEGDKLYTGVKLENSVVKNLYERVGFKGTGEIPWGEEILKVDL